MSSTRSLLSLGLPKDIFTALVRNGYETLQDLSSATVESLSKDLNLSEADVEALLAHRTIASQARGAGAAPGLTPLPSLQMTQSAAAMIQGSHKISTRCPALDKVLDGGLTRGHVLELSGPPGSPKEKLAIGIVASLVEKGEEVVFVDCQHMTSPAILSQSLERLIPNSGKDLQQLVQYTQMHDLPQFLLFIHQLPTILKSRPKVSLLVINSVSFPFQTAILNPSDKNLHLERVKQAFARATASSRLTIVVTSQLATKMVNADGSPGTFDSGARGVVLPQLAAAYLPGGKSHRVILSLDGLMSGHIKVLSNPKYPHGSNGKMPLIIQPFTIEDGNVV